ncbi:hypothetical protein CRG98_046311 [Punica granatum]|uniref:Uncharacterized protein n=1 Tax=Punica granatum TaxID=22663 RepID=A0A2I0HNI5_PUNGR|nr:hypothetical protein CRG98_046311 [Punica granatum]
MVIPSHGMLDGTVKSRFEPLMGRVGLILIAQTRLEHPERAGGFKRFGPVAPSGFWLHEWWSTVAKEPLEVAVVVAWQDRSRVGSNCKENQGKPEKQTLLGSRDLLTLGHPWDVCEGGWWVVVALSDSQSLKSGEATDPIRSYCSILVISKLGNGLKGSKIGQI